MSKFTPEVHATACVAGEAITNALEAWRKDAGAQYWPSRATGELEGMQHALSAARTNLAAGASASLAYEGAYEQACRYLAGLDSATAEQLRDLNTSLLSIVGGMAEDLDCGQELYTVLMFYQNW